MHTSARGRAPGADAQMHIGFRGGYSWLRLRATRAQRQQLET